MTVNRMSKSSMSAPTRYRNASTGVVVPGVVSGGILSEDSTYYYRTFTSTGTLTVADGSVATDVLVVAGGGGGGDGSARAGGGGGAGGFLAQTKTLSPGSYAITIGAGGTTNANGSSSTGFSLTAIGGGRGGVVGVVGSAGGSGGGSGEFYNGAGGSGTVGQGNNGGAASGSSYSGGGGGGAGGVGANYNSPTTGGGAGGPGAIFGNSYYAGGGSGGSDFDGPSGSPASNLPGIGGGGRGAYSSAAGGAGTANTGGGGGGGGGNGGSSQPAGAGGSGIVIVRYAKDAITASTDSYELIGTLDLLSPQSALTFTGIPQQYKHLQIRMSMQVTGSSGNDLKLRFNGDSTTGNYKDHGLYGFAGASSTGSAYSGPVFTDGIYCLSAYPTSETNLFAGAVFDILDFANTSKNKTVRGISGKPRATDGVVYFQSGAWFSTAAITSLTIVSHSGTTFAPYTRVSLYGLRA